VNDDSSVKVWQDERVTEHSASAGSAAKPADSEVNLAARVRSVSTAAELKALADPLRLSILAALTRDAPRELRVLSVKELAAELGEPKTKLYRHIKQLEAAGLIRVASTRLVSGIVEQRYQACQGDLSIGPGVTRDPATAGEAVATVTAILDRYRGRYLAHLARTRLAGEPAPREPYRQATLSLASTTVSPAKAQAVRDRLREVMAELDEAYDGADAIKVEILVGFMSPD
jgi:DNA-binding transcriptional ArsR family regulator